MFNKTYSLCLYTCLFFTLGAIPNAAQADTPFIGEVRWFAGSFAPRDWAECDGQLLQIASNTALFSILGTTYGGDGRVTFGLPDLRGRAMVHTGNGPGLSSRPRGQKAGSESETVQVTQLPSHQHTLKASSTRGDSVLPDNRAISRVGRLRIFANTPDTDMGATSIADTGGGQSHNNMQPYIPMTCIIALQGVFPSRN